MFKFCFIACIYCTLMPALAINGNKANSLHTEDAVVITALTLNSNDIDKSVTRQKRQFINDVPYPLYPSSACITSTGLYGTCVYYNQCQSYGKLLPFLQYNNWMLRMPEACMFLAPTGNQEIGVCCQQSDLTQYPVYPPFYPQNPDAGLYPQNPDPGLYPQNPDAGLYPQNPDSGQYPENPDSGQYPENPDAGQYPEDPDAGVYPQNPDTGGAPPFDNPFEYPYPPPDNSWPPPLPTHPPEHATAPTHATAVTTKPSSVHWPPTQSTRPTVPPPPNRPPPPPPIYPGSVKPTTRPPYKPPSTPPYKPPTTPPYKPSTPKPQWTKPTIKPPRPEWPATRPTTTYPTTPAEVEEIPTNYTECGIKNGKQDQERIVGGQDADLGEWPWMAAILTSGRLFCGGSLIDNLHILTAAHCVAHMNPWDVARLRVNLGDHNIKSKSDVVHIERKVKKVVRHRGFDSHTLYNDIALLTLDAPVTFTKTIRPVCLPQSRISTSGRMATVIGWGSVREMGPTPSILQEVSIPIWTNQECRNKYGPAAPGGIIDSFLCAGKTRKDSCSGDSGGPLMINDGKWQQVGIVSWGIGCGKGQFPGVYTRISSFMSWIQKNLNV